MNFKRQHLKDLVDFCGGNPNLVKTWITDIVNKEIKTIEELEDYPMKLHYSSLIPKSDAPIFRKLFIDDYCWEKYSTLTLGTIIDDMYECPSRYEDINKEDFIKELINLKFGSMEYDW